MGDTSRRPPERVILGLALALITVAATLVAAVVPDLVTPDARHRPPWWALAPLFALSEYLAVHLRTGRSAYTVSFGHVPLVLGLCLLDPSGFLAASLLGSAYTLLVHRRQRGLKLLFNGGLWLFEATVAVSLYGLLAAGAPVASLRSLAAAYATIVVTDQLTALAVTTVISLHEGSVDADSVKEAVTWGLLVAVCNCSVGLLVVVLLESQPVAVPMLAVLIAVLALSYRAYVQLHDTHVQLGRHHDFSQSLAQEQGFGGVIDEVLERTREMLEAEAAELHVAGQVFRSPADAAAPPRTTSTAFWLDRMASGGVLLTRDTKDPAGRRLLAAAGARDGAAAPVRISSGGDGVLVVLGRLGETASFTADDVRALETFAHQAGTALENGQLVDRLRREAAEREHQALHDPLTGLSNRRGFQLEVDALLASSGRAGVVLLDLDRFKEVNDALGHTMGDEVLRAVGSRLRDCLPPSAHVARLGGDEFAVLLRTGDGDVSLGVTAGDIASALGAVLDVDGVALHVEASIGSATAPADSDSSEGLLQRADAAMYRAKDQRTRYEAWGTTSDRSSAERLALYSDLRSAVTRGLLDVYYQPSVDPGTGDVVGAEALVRWTDPTRGAVSPEEFVPLAERSELIVPLTALVLRRALTDLARLRRLRLLTHVAVNVSPRVLLDRGLPSLVEQMLDDAGLPASALTLEVTESAVMADPTTALTVLTELQALGVRLSVDDYGTGYSSLSYLRRLPVHEVKIDRSFVTHLATEDGDAVIVRSTIELAHQLGLSVVAEGVEDVETLHLLGLWGCDTVQGFFVSRAIAADALEDWLRCRADGVSADVRLARR